MKNLTIQQKLIGLAVFVIAAVAGMGAFGLYQVYRTNINVEDLATSWLPSIKILGEINHDIADYRLKDAAHILMSTAEDRANVNKQQEEVRQSLEKGLQAYEGMVSDANERALFEDVKQKLATYQQAGAKLRTLSDADNDAEATSYYRGDMKKVFDALNVSLDELVKVNEAGADASYKEAEAGYRTTLVVMISAIAAVCAVACVVSYMVISSVTSGVTELTRVFTGLASLDLRMRGASKVHDEIGRILGQFNTTAETLTAVVQGTQEAATSVAAASHELSSGMDNIAAIVQQQEGSLTSIAAALEETSQSSSEVNTKAQRSGKTTLEVVNDIGRVVDRVAELRMKADSISAVLDIIRNVSEQINLLSLNATIEAARAGDSGRGFAVVAEEVKKLAGSTGTSTDEISKVVADLQKSVGEASEALAAVTGSLEEVRGNSDSVVSAVGQQTIAVKNITETIEEFRHQMSVVTSNIKEAQTASLSLSAAAEELNRQNSQFKV